MKYLLVACVLAASAVGGFGQSADLGGSGGIQFSGVLSANVINDFKASTATLDNDAGLSFLQLNATLKDGPYGFDSQGVVGPGGSSAVKYLYGYASFLNSSIYLAVGKWVDPDTFALISYFQEGADGPGSYGNPSAPNRTGLSGQGINGVELKISPLKGLVFGFLLPYQNPGGDTVNTSLRRISGAASYTLEKRVQLVAGYTQGHTGVADLASPINNLGQNKFYTLANVLVSEDLTLGARYELDHYVAGTEAAPLDPSTWHVISQNGYFTLGEKFGDLSIGGDVGLFFPESGSAGFEVLTAASYTVHAITPGVDFQPYATVSYFSSSYPGNTVNSISLNPQLRLLLGKNQHELAVGYTLTYDLDHRQATVEQLNLLIQLYF